WTVATRPGSATTPAWRSHALTVDVDFSPRPTMATSAARALERVQLCQVVLGYATVGVVAGGLLVATAGAGEVTFRLERAPVLDVRRVQLVEHHRVTRVTRVQILEPLDHQRPVLAPSLVDLVHVRPDGPVLACADRHRRRDDRRTPRRGSRVVGGQPERR